ncbi:hypothetical protein ACHAWF_009440 [Thalassiosira exigua]
MTGSRSPAPERGPPSSVTPSATRRPVHRSTSSSGAASALAAGSSPRFTFDFVDDASLASGSSYSHLSRGSSPTARRAPKLSPSPLDARYSARLPPSYGAHGTGRKEYHRSYTSPEMSPGELRRNLFGGSEGGSAAGTTPGGTPGGSVAAMDESSDFEDASMAGSDVRTPGSGRNSQLNTPNSQRSLSHSERASRANSLSSSLSSPRGALLRGRSDATPNRGGSVLSVQTGTRSAARTSQTSHTYQTTVTGASALSSSGRSVRSFLSSSPRRRGIGLGLVEGAASPLAGDLGRVDPSACSSAASSPANSVTGGYGASYGASYSHAGYASGALSAEREARGAGDRFIPSRALSNLTFDLAAGAGGGRGYGSHRGANDNDHGGNAANGNDNNVNVAAGEEDLAPAPSFGAPLVGGGAEQVPAPAAGGAAAAAGGAAGAAGGGGDLGATFSDDADPSSEASERHDATNRQPLLYDALLRSELLGENVDPSAQRSARSPTGLVAADGGREREGPSTTTPFRERSNNLRFSPAGNHAARQFFQNAVYSNAGENARDADRAAVVNAFRLSPVSPPPHGRRACLGSYTERCKRRIAKVPTKVLDAPALQDDFYLNLVDWSSQNVLAVGLGSCVYLWSAATSRVTQLCDLSVTEDAVTSVAWSEGGRHLAVGSTRGDVQLWDAPAQRLVRTMHGHSARVGALSWKLSGAAGGGAGGGGAQSHGVGGGHHSLLASGSRDRLIHLRDPRSDRPYEMRLCGHKQEVCGLKWGFDERSMLASGGNDNKLLVWDVKRHAQPHHVFADHTAAVKAIAWSPHQHGLLASGGGTADRCIRFWNCLTGHGINCIDTGSQVCNLAFSRNCNELVSTHGYSLNQIGESSPAERAGPRVEVPLDAEDRDPHRSHVPRPVPRPLPRRVDHRHGSRRRDAPILAGLSRSAEVEQGGGTAVPRGHARLGRAVTGSARPRSARAKGPLRRGAATREP